MNNTLFYHSFSFHTWTRKAPYEYKSTEGTQFFFLAKLIKGWVRLVGEKEEIIEVHTGEMFFLPRGMKYKSFWYANEGEDTVVWESCCFTYFPEEKERTYCMQKLEIAPDTFEEISLICERCVVSCESVGKLYLALSRLMPYLLAKEKCKKEILREKIIEYIRSHPNFKVPELARACCMSESTLFLFFKNYLHTTPVALKWHLLTERAQDMLIYEDIPIEQIASELGFESVAHFRKIIRMHTNKTPSEIRRENKNKRGM